MNVSTFTILRIVARCCFCPRAACIDGWGGNSDDCCLDLAHVGTPPPDWAARANPTFAGRVHDEYSDLDTLEWVFDNLTATTSTRLAHHTTRQVAPGQPLAGVSVLFTFPGNANGRQDYHFNVTSMIVGQQDPSLFHLPEQCKHVPCSPPSQMQQEAAIQTIH